MYRTPLSYVNRAEYNEVSDRLSIITRQIVVICQVAAESKEVVDSAEPDWYCTSSRELIGLCPRVVDYNFVEFITGKVKPIIDGFVTSSPTSMVALNDERHDRPLILTY